MQEQNPRYQGHYLLVIMFFGVIIISLILVVTGVAFVELAPEKMAFVLMILVPIGAMMAGVIFIYSLARYTVENRFRN
ncbi:MAG: hypothetical protein KAU48_08065, partial [Candidatus Thorarchaeota archaeon]|nr:hypothetical protein [Candidatus Thorarchaeota archaeon]